jgi:hypothetical protein
MGCLRQNVQKCIQVCQSGLFYLFYSVDFALGNKDWAFRAVLNEGDYTHKSPSVNGAPVNPKFRGGLLQCSVFGLPPLAQCFHVETPRKQKAWLTNIRKKKSRAAQFAQATRLSPSVERPAAFRPRLAAGLALSGAQGKHAFAQMSSRNLLFYLPCL